MKNAQDKATTVWTYNEDNKVLTESYYDVKGKPEEQEFLERWVNVVDYE